MAADLPFSTTWPGTLQDVIPSYAFQEYADDADIKAFITAYNRLAQGYVDWFNQIDLPIYTNPLIAGALLDWVGNGLYGVQRPTLQSGSSFTIGPYNTYAYNTLALNTSQTTIVSSSFVANDDIYKRVLTWQHYKGDGFQFNITWLKRRIMRFLLGVNGTDPVGTNDLRDVSISSAWVIRIRNSASFPAAQALSDCILGGVVNLPFQFTYTVQLA